MADVPLVDLEVILRYSLAIRQETADAREVLEALDQSRGYVLELLRQETGEELADTGSDATADSDGTAEVEAAAEVEVAAEVEAAEPEEAEQPEPEQPEVDEPVDAAAGNGEVDAENLPKPLPKEEAAARRAARRARRAKQ